MKLLPHQLRHHVPALIAVNAVKDQGHHHHQLGQVVQPMQTTNDQRQPQLILPLKLRMHHTNMMTTMKITTKDRRQTNVEKMPRPFSRFKEHGVFVYSASE
jgi:hypothetical protein